MMAPDPFYVGGDLNDLQIKGLNASVTNINTLNVLFLKYNYSFNPPKNIYLKI